MGGAVGNLSSRRFPEHPGLGSCQGCDLLWVGAVGTSSPTGGSLSPGPVTQTAIQEGAFEPCSGRDVSKQI